MNLVFQALALLSFILPGILFRSAYKKAFWNYPLGRLGPVTDQIPRSIVHASWLNATWAILVGWLHSARPTLIKSVDYRAVVYWLTNNFGKDQVNFDRAVGSMANSPLHVFFYFIGLYVYSILFGWFIHWLVRSRGIDKKYSLFRFDNDWYYLFNGEALDFPDYRSPHGDAAKMKHEDRSGTLIAAVVDLKDKSYLYLGIYVDSFWDGSGNLDRILLEGAKRRELSSDTPEGPQDFSHLASDNYYPIKGNFFILRMSEIKTLNVAYFTGELLDYIADAKKFDELQRLVSEMQRGEEAFNGNNAIEN